MTSGYCAHCHKLVAIIPREFKNDRQRNWYPEYHEYKGIECAGVKRPL